MGEFCPLHIGKNTIGSSPKCDICLSEATVSENHASITVRVLENQEKTIASLKDTDSTNGTKINGEDVDFDANKIKNGDIIRFGTNYECLLILIDTKETDTPLKLHHPVARDCAVFEEPWAQGSSPYMCVLRDGNRYLMYTDHPTGLICSESADGIHWERPGRGLVELNGSRDNALVAFTESGDGADSEPCAGHFDGFRAFVDDNPAALPEERIKAVANVNARLHVYVSSDGLRFRHVGPLSVPAENPGTPYDSVNTLFSLPLSDTCEWAASV